MTVEGAGIHPTTSVHWDFHLLSRCIWVALFFPLETIMYIFFLIKNTHTKKKQKLSPYANMICFQMQKKFMGNGMCAIRDKNGNEF